MELHVFGSHPECTKCKKRFESVEDLTKHMESHEVIKCDICQQDVPKVDEESHGKMHENCELFGKVLKKGKITKDKKSTKPTAYNVFVKENYNSVLTEMRTNGERSGRSEVMKTLGERLKRMTTDEKKIYKDMTGSTKLLSLV